VSLSKQFDLSPKAHSVLARTDCFQTSLIFKLMIDLGNNIIALVSAIRNFLEGLNDTHLNSFLADWPSPNSEQRPVYPHSLPVLSWMPAAVKRPASKLRLW